MQNSLLDIHIATVANIDELTVLAHDTFYETQISEDLELYLERTFSKQPPPEEVALKNPLKGGYFLKRFFYSRE